MKRSVIKVSVALVTFTIGIVFALIFTANPRGGTESLFAPPPAPEIRLVPPAPPPPPPGPAVTAFDLVEPAAAEKIVLDYDPQEFNPRGDYFILGKKPKDFREFDVFELAVDEIDGRASGGAIIVTDSGAGQNSYYNVSGLVTKKRLTFVAVPRFEEDFEYRFEGRFLKSGWVSAARKKQPVAKGKLIKLKNGVKIAECQIKFRVEYLGC